MTKEETDLRAATDAWMAANPTTSAGMAASIVYDEIQNQSALAELAKHPPIPPAQSAANWSALKAYLTDRGGLTDVDKLIAQVDTAIAADQQVAVTSGCYGIYKAHKKIRP